MTLGAAKGSGWLADGNAGKHCRTPSAINTFHDVSQISVTFYMAQLAKRLIFRGLEVSQGSVPSLIALISRRGIDDHIPGRWAYTRASSQELDL